MAYIYGRHQDRGVWFTRDDGTEYLRESQQEEWFSGSDARMAAAHYNGAHHGRTLHSCPICHQPNGGSNA